MINSRDGGATHPIGTGPFTFESWTPGASFKVVKNPNYWQKGQPHLDSITFRVIPDESTLVSALQSGDINMMLTTNAPTPTGWLALHGGEGLATPRTTSSRSTPRRASTASPTRSATSTPAWRSPTPPTATAVAKQIGDGRQDGQLAVVAAATPGACPTARTAGSTTTRPRSRQELAAYEADTGQATLKLHAHRRHRLRHRPDPPTAPGPVGVRSASTPTSRPWTRPPPIKQLVAAQYQALFLVLLQLPRPRQRLGVLVVEDRRTASAAININFRLYSNPQIDQDLATGRTNPYPTKRKAAYDDLVHQLNAAAVNDWLYRTPYSLIAQPPGARARHRPPRCRSATTNPRPGSASCG